MLYSLSKSFASTAAGLAIAEGKLSLDDSVLSFFPEDAPVEASDNWKAMRVRHLLANGAQLVHDFAVHGKGVAVGVGRHRRGAEKRLFDTEALAMDRHLKSPTLDASVVDRGVLTPGSHVKGV